MHEVTQKWEELSIGTEIKVSGSPIVCTIKGFSGDKIVVSQLHETLLVCYGDYICSYLESPDFVQQNDPTLDAETWRRCEQWYGISFHGSNDTDPRRKLALMALKGDGMSLDMISDTLKF